jgi:hypothetical protein
MLTTNDLDKLRAEHPRGIVHLIGKGDTWECVFRAPTRAEYKMFRANAHNPTRVADANDTLAIQTVVYPAREAFQAMLETYPGIPEAFASNDELKALTGVAVEEGAKL